MLLTRTTGGDVMGAATSTLKSAATAGAGAAKDAATGAADRAANAVMDAAGSVSDRVAGAAVSAHQTTVDGMASVKNRLQSGLDSGKAELDARRQQAGALADDLSDQAQTMAQQARQSFARLIEEQPILMAALGAALGAAVGAMLPLSQSEKDLIGSTGAKAIEAGHGALASAADVVRQEAASADLGARMGELADKVVQTVTNDVVRPA
jgi:ElaB/YqjD/DUF883 family membrane-anchored ribosome-binding protein